MNLRFLLACAANRIDPIHWHDLDVREDPEIRAFMERLELRIVIDERDFMLAKLEDQQTSQMRVEVIAQGKSFKEKIPYLKGAPEPEEFRNTDEELVNKFHSNASRTLSLGKASKAAQMILEMEKLRNVTELMETVTP